MIIKKYEKIDSRIILIDQKNIGLTKSLNKAINIAKGDYIARMDSDDISLLDRFMNFINYYKKNQNLMIYTNPAITIDSFGNSVRKIPSYLRRNGFNVRMLDYTNSLIHGTLIINSDLLKPVFSIHSSIWMDNSTGAEKDIVIDLAILLVEIIKLQ